ncbi:MAG: glycosyltransferase, partial [Ectothiorhodospiraceae bacterium]
HRGDCPRVVVSVVSHGQGRLVAALLDDIRRYWDHDGLHVVVTQNLPEAAPAGIENMPIPVRVVRNSRPKGFAANHNAAFRVFDSDVFCVVNPDIRCPEDPLPALRRVLTRPEVALAAPQVVSPDGSLEDSARRRITPWRIVKRVCGLERGPDYTIQDRLVFPDWVGGMFMVLRSGVFERLGGFDERFRLYCEDADLCMRLWQSGCRVVVTPGTRVVHDARRGSHRNLQLLRWHVASLLRLFARYPFYRRLPGPRLASAEGG